MCVIGFFKIRGKDTQKFANMQIKNAKKLAYMQFLLYFCSLKCIICCLKYGNPRRFVT